MTSEHVNSFVTDLVQMAKAMERVPELEHELRTLERLNSSLIDEITQANLSLEASRCYAAGLEQKVHDLEVANTAAELRFLECDDAKGTLVRVLEGFMADAKGVLAAIAPLAKLKPLPVAEPSAAMGESSAYSIGQEVKSSESSTFPTNISDIPLQDGLLSPFVLPPTPDITPSTDASSSEGTEGESASHPTDATTPQADANTKPVPSIDTASGEGVSVPSNPTVASIALDGPNTSAPLNVSLTIDASSPKPYDDKWMPF